MRLILEDYVEGKNSRGLLRTEYIQQVMKYQEQNVYKKPKRKTNNREKWRIATNQFQD